MADTQTLIIAEHPCALQVQILCASGLGDGALPPPANPTSCATAGTLVCHTAPFDAATGQAAVLFRPLYELHNGLPFDVIFQLTALSSPGASSHCAFLTACIA